MLCMCDVGGLVLWMCDVGGLGWCWAFISTTFTHQNAGENSIANLDHLYHTSNGETHTAELRLRMQRVCKMAALTTAAHHPMC